MSESALEQIKRMAQSLSLGDRVILVEELAHGLGQESADDQRTPPQSLRGSWRGKFPDDFDIDSALHEIRHEWEEELLDVAPGTRAEEGSDRR
jgi:hypothetical protein